MRRRQGGIVLVLYTLGLIAVIGMAGFALDLGRAYLNKTRLQNAVDAAALDGAKVLFQTGSTTKATTAAQDSLNQNITGATPAITFSSTWPFGAAGLGPKYIKVVVSSFPVNATLSAVFLGKSAFTVAGEAVAGPLPLGGSTCGAPIGICGLAGSADQDCSDGNGCYGIGAGEQQLKDAAIGPGNYGLMDMAGKGANKAIDDAFAGATGFCAKKGDNKATEPGNKTSKIAEAVNSRFGQGGQPYDDQSKYPPDVVSSIAFNTYATYKLALQSGLWDRPDGVPRRRTSVVPVIDCSTVQGSSTAQVLAMACVFLTRPVGTTNPDKGTVYVEMISDACASDSGVPTNDPTSTAARIVLYQSGAQS